MSLKIAAETDVCSFIFTRALLDQKS